MSGQISLYLIDMRAHQIAIMASNLIDLKCGPDIEVFERDEG